MGVVFVAKIYSVKDELINALYTVLSDLFIKQNTVDYSTVTL